MKSMRNKIIKKINQIIVFIVNFIKEDNQNLNFVYETIKKSIEKHWSPHTNIWIKRTKV